MKRAIYPQEKGLEQILSLPLQPSERTPGVQTSNLQTVRQHISVFKPPSLWCFVTGALGN